MTEADFAALVIADKGQVARPITLVAAAAFDDWLTRQPPRARAAAAAHKLTATAQSSAILPGDDPEDWSVALVVTDPAALDAWSLARLAETLPEGCYRLIGGAPGAAALGWMLGQHRFGRYRQAEATTPARVLLSGEPARIPGIAAVARATSIVRDLVNIGASDLGPAELEAAAEMLANAHDAALTVVRGDALISGYPMIHVVGQAATKARAPRLIELAWGDPRHPRLTVIGKGVCFDSGGLNIKPGSGMRLMKKDMGGAAHALALAGLIMGQRLKVRLHLMIPAVENAIAGNAFRPGDVLNSRAGLMVENTNTDAEGRLILADALTRAIEDTPDLIIDFATLTGAARVALGPDLPALFSNDPAIAADVIAAGAATDDPVWQLPLWDGYDEMLKSDIADLVNAPDGGFAGAITAALFLRRFVPADRRWVHIDTFAWRPTSKPGRPKGGEALGLRAVWAMLGERYGQVGMPLH